MSTVTTELPVLPATPIGVAATTRLKTLVARTAEDALALEADWKSLETHSDGVALFQSFEWCRAVLETSVTAQNNIYVCCAYDGEALIGVLPLKLIRKKFRTVLTGLGEPFQQYTEMLLAPGYSAKHVFAALRTDIGKAGADYIHLGQVRQDGPLAAGIDGDIPPAGEKKGAPFVDLSQHANFDAYMRTLNAKTRKNMRNARNRLERDGVLTHETATDGPLLDSVITATFAGRTEWLKRIGLTSRAFADSGFEDFLNQFREPKETGLTPIAMRLTRDQDPIAEQWGFVHGGRYYAYISTWDTDFEGSSPGKMHLGEVVRACFDKGIKVADFMAPDVPYKLTWASGVTPVRDHVLAFSLIGFLYARIWLGFVRPTLKRIAQSLPAETRKRFVDLILRRG